MIIILPNKTATDTEDYWDSEGLQIKMIEPMKKWRVYYEGEMIKQCTNAKLNVKLEVGNNLPVIFPEFYLKFFLWRKNYLITLYKRFRGNTALICHSLILTQIWILGPLHVHSQKKLGLGNILIEYEGKYLRISVFNLL